MDMSPDTTSQTPRPGREPGAGRNRAARQRPTINHVPAVAGVSRSLVTRRSQSVAFILSDTQEKFFEDPNFPTLLRGCTQGLAQHDIQLVLMIAGSQAERRRVSRYLTAGHVDGA